MHDLLEEMGCEIVRQECMKEPGKRSRLWRYEDVCHVLNHNTATEAVESIIVRWPHSNNVVELNMAFVKMTELRLLRVHSYYLPAKHPMVDENQYEDLKFLSGKLSCLFWPNCPLKFLSSKFNPENLVDLDMQYSRVEHLWKGTKPLEKLKVINLKGSQLEETPDFTKARNLEKLILDGCTSLSEVHPSIWALEKLVLLDLSWCYRLQTISSISCMKSLETLNLSFCSNIEKFPEILEVREKLSKLCLRGTSMKELPRSINNLTGLVTLNLECCRELEMLPSSIVQLKSLKFLCLSGCSKLEAFPKNVENMEGLKELCLDETSVRELCPSIFFLQNLERLSLEQCTKLHSIPSSIHMRSLRNLNLSGCSNLERFPEIPEVMENLSELYVDGTGIAELPSSIKNFTGLVTLNMKGCKRFKVLPSSIHMRSLQALNLSGCSNLMNFPMILEVMENLSELHLDWFVYSTKFEKPTELDSFLDSTTSNNLTEHEGYIHDHRTFTIQHLQQLPHVSGIAIKELPSVIYNLTGIVTLTLRYSKGFKSLTSRICQLKSLNYLSLSGCTEFEVFPDIVENMERLASLDLDETSIRELPQSIERLQGLVSLNLKNCKNLVYLPDSICNLLSLEWLTLSGCSKLSKLPEDLLYLKRLDVKGTGKKQRYFSTLGELAQFRSAEPLIDIAGSSMSTRRRWLMGESSRAIVPSAQGSRLSTLGDSVQSQSTVLLSVMLDEENEAMAVGETLSNLEESSYKEEEEKALAASRRGGRIWGCCICGARGNED
ncbi:hypothetical protein C1H46_021123 [Malus baccata]|uniref:Disease resistance protein RPS4B/Roq1-like leucine-rich repeats domain-containing protein n=1 Tax=Malus baccata TaxID=106549 RepID=A0A540M3E0_MALBA|nr:hypothetical protein C1H46_021123 [Malus baccata]